MCSSSRMSCNIRERGDLILSLSEGTKMAASERIFNVPSHISEYDVQTVIIKYIDEYPTTTKSISTANFHYIVTFRTLIDNTKSIYYGYLIFSFDAHR